METSTILLLFFFNDTATTEIYTLSLHDALPISVLGSTLIAMKKASIAEKQTHEREEWRRQGVGGLVRDRKSTRLNSSHGYISYAVFCLKKKKNNCDLFIRSHTRRNHHQQSLHSN